MGNITNIFIQNSVKEITEFPKYITLGQYLNIYKETVISEYRIKNKLHAVLETCGNMIMNTERSNLEIKLKK